MVQNKLWLERAIHTSREEMQDEDWGRDGATEGQEMVEVGESQTQHFFLFFENL